MRIMSAPSAMEMAYADLQKAIATEDLEAVLVHSDKSILILFYSFYFILFYFILFYFILFYSILFYFILFYSILFYFIFSAEFFVYDYYFISCAAHTLIYFARFRS